MMNLEGTNPDAFDKDKMTLADKWILSRLAKTIKHTTDCLVDFKFSEPINELYKFFWNDFCDWYLEWAKPRMNDAEQKPIAQNILSFVLDQTLRLLHPFIPFITEGIFGKLNEIVPERKLTSISDAPVSDAMAIAKWPANIDSLIDDNTESDIDYIQTVTRSLRDLRSKYNVATGKKMVASVSGPANVVDILNQNGHLVCQLANLQELRVAENIEKPQNAAAAIIEQMQVYLHDAIDVEAELDRLKKQKEQTEKQKEGVERKLANENFVNKAKPEVVAQARQKLNKLTEQLETIEKLLAKLQN